MSSYSPYNKKKTSNIIVFYSILITWLPNAFVSWIKIYTFYLLFDVVLGYLL